MQKYDNLSFLFKKLVNLLILFNLLLRAIKYNKKF